MAEPEAPKHETTLDTGKQQVGEVYAASLLNAADAAGETQDVLAEFQSPIDDVLNANAQFESILSSPRISHAEKESILNWVPGSNTEDDQHQDEDDQCIDRHVFLEFT